MKGNFQTHFLGEVRAVFSVAFRTSRRQNMTTYLTYWTHFRFLSA